MTTTDNKNTAANLPASTENHECPCKAKARARRRLWIGITVAAVVAAAVGYFIYKRRKAA